MNWLEVKENLILFENFTCILKDNMRKTFTKDTESIKMSKLYFNKEFPELKHTRKRDKKQALKAQL
jgi:hypothetical protein